MKIKELCAKYIEECGGDVPVLKFLQDCDIGAKKAPGTARDYIDHCRMRRRKCLPGTVMHDIIALRGVLSYAKPGWAMADVTDAPIREAWPVLRKEGLIGRSRRRSRFPSDNETAQIAAVFRDGRIKTAIPMADIVEFQDDSTRRISETLALMRKDLDPDTKTVIVRDMKHPRVKQGNDVRVALPPKSFEILMRQPVQSTDPEARFFPYPVETVKRLYRQAVRLLGFRDLRLHDSRRAGTTRLLKAGYPIAAVIAVTGHMGPVMALTTYNGMRAEDFHKIGAARRTADA